MKTSNQKLLQMLGLDGIKGITSVDIEMRVNQLPKVTVHIWAPDFSGTEQKQFSLIAYTPEPAPTSIDPLRDVTRLNDSERRYIAVSSTKD